MPFNPDTSGGAQGEHYPHPTLEQIRQMNRAITEVACSNCFAEELDDPKLDAIEDDEAARWAAYQRCKDKGLCKA